MGSVSRLIRWFVCGVASVFLPSPERERIAVPAGVSPPHWSFVGGLVGGAIGMFLYLEGALAFMSDLGGRQAAALLQSNDPATGVAIVRLGGILTWFAWHLQPMAWLSMYLAFTGLVRVAAFLATNEAVAEPLLWAPMRFLGSRRRKVQQMRRRVELGPQRPDRAIEEDGCDLVVLSCREKSNWDETATIRIGERHYRLIDVADRADGRWKVIAYRLRESNSGEAVRCVVKADIEVPKGHAGGACRAPAGKFWFLAFGATLDGAALKAVAPSIRQVGVARLPRHALRFERPVGNGVGEAAAMPTGNPSDIVWGVVWECDDVDADAVAELEGVGDECVWQHVEVRSSDTERYAVCVSLVNEKQRDGSLLPSREYRDELLNVARTYPFPRIYLGLLRSAPTKTN